MQERKTSGEFDTGFDGHKLACHPREVAQWLETGRTSGPLYTEFELSNRCNCRCIFCGVDYIVNSNGHAIDTDVARRALEGLAEAGNKSVMFCGDGEPLLHEDAAQIIQFAGQRMSASVTTNGLALTDDNIELIDDLAWIRFSINAGTPESYAAIQGTAPGMFDRVLANVQAAVERKRRKKLRATIGTQLVLLPENADETLSLARRLKAIGVDYFSVKPYSQHPLSNHRRSVDYDPLAHLEADLQRLDSPAFRIIWRAGSIEKVGQAKPYGTCRGTHFISFISANGDVWECNVFVGDARFLTGNVYHQSVREIWDSQRRKDVVAFIENELGLSECRDVCRMDACNRYLWRLRHPLPHDDFI